MPTRKIEKYEDALELIGCLNNKKCFEIIKRLEKEGRSERSICFAIWKGQDSITNFKGDNRFYSVFENEIKKWAWSSSDPRWKDYNKRKEEKDRVRQQQLKEFETRKKEEEYRLKYPGYVYFIQGESGGPIKIGYATDIANRLAGLQTGHYDNLMVLQHIPAKMQDERDLHKKFSELRLRGEWFKPTSELLEFINSLPPQASNYNKTIKSL